MLQGNMSCQLQNCQKDIDEAFDIFDKNGNGKIEVKELKEAMKYCRCLPSDDFIAEMLKQHDKDANGSLSKDEFIQFMKEAHEKEMREIFQAFDKDGSGFITKDDVNHVKQAALNKMHVELSDKEVDDMIAKADTDKDGKVGFEDINECNVTRPCNSLANCVNTIGSFKCGCQAGYSGNEFMKWADHADRYR